MLPTVIMTEDMGRGPRRHGQGVSNGQAWHDKRPDDSGQSRLSGQSRDCRQRSAADCRERGPLPSPSKLDGPARDKGGHRGPPCDLLVEWESGGRTHGPLRTPHKGDPANVASHARDNDLIEESHSPRTDIKRVLR